MKPTKSFLFFCILNCLFFLLTCALSRANCDAFEDWFNGRPSPVGTDRALMLYASNLPFEGRSLRRLSAYVKRLDREEGVLRSALLKDYLQKNESIGSLTPLWPLLSESRRHTKLAAEKHDDDVVQRSAQKIDHLLEAVLTLDEVDETLAEPSFDGLNGKKLQQERRRTLIQYGLSETKSLCNYLLERGESSNAAMQRAGHYIDKTASTLGQARELDDEKSRLLVQFLSAALYELSAAH